MNNLVKNIAIMYCKIVRGLFGSFDYDEWINFFFVASFYAILFVFPVLFIISFFILPLLIVVASALGIIIALDVIVGIFHIFYVLVLEKIEKAIHNRAKLECPNCKLCVL